MLNRIEGSAVKAAVATVLAFLGVLASPMAAAAQDATPTPGISTPPPSAVAERVYTDPAATIRTHVDQIFLIALDANRTTGFSWQPVPASEALVQAIGSTFAVADASQPGAGGEQIWVVRATAAGKTTLTFRYFRPFDKTTLAGAKQATFQVEVAP